MATAAAAVSTSLQMHIFVYLLLQLAQGASMAPKKATRIGALRCRLPFVSQAALGALLKLSKDGELPEVNNRNDIRDDRDAYVAIAGLYGTLHQEVVIADGVTLEVCAPAAMLVHASRFGPMQRLLDRALRLHGPRLHVVIYADEVTPGNQIAHKQARKTWAWYWTIQEFGPAALSDEATWSCFQLDACCRCPARAGHRQQLDAKPTPCSPQDAWFQCVSMRTVVTNQLPHGPASLFSAVLELFWPEEGGHNLETAGISLAIGGRQPQQVLLSLGTIMQVRCRDRPDETVTDCQSLSCTCTCTCTCTCSCTCTCTCTCMCMCMCVRSFM